MGCSEAYCYVLARCSHVRYGAAERLRRGSRLTGRNDPDPVTSRLA